MESNRAKGKGQRVKGDPSAIPFTSNPLPSSNPRIIGVLGLQGDFREHIEKLRSLGAKTRDVRHLSDLDGIDALIIPGGESTAVAIVEKSDTAHGIFEKITELSNKGLPIWGTCMGSILLAKNIEGSTQGRLGVMDITVRRNAFGPQRFSAEIPIPIPAIGDESFPGVFIRAPIITEVGKNVEVLGKLEQGIVIAREKNLLATVFHPEVVNDTRVHEYFLSMIV